ncbi:MAG: glycine cleavage system protein GcvH [Thermoprotei archaeon]|nr:MAG: glycine cleavage system protein GcvH [Thermoprotei archaeon]
MKYKEYEVNENVLYTKTHEWAKIENGKVRVGLTDYAVKKLKDIVYIEPQDIGQHVKKGDPIAAIDSIKASENVYAPVSGKIVEINSEVVEDPTLINRDPYGEGWILVIEVENPEEIDELLKPEDYVKLLEKEEH